MNNKRKFMAMLMVAAMLAVSIVPLADMNGSDATSGDGGAYSYTLVYDSSVMATGTNSLSLADMTAIYHPSYDSTSVAGDNDGTTGYGSWTWDLETGLGPFNSFYAAFDIDDNNRMLARLNPFDLSKTIDGYDLPADHRYNIMWVLPTVYWKIGEVTVEVPGETEGTTEEVTYPTITLTNDSTAGGIAYAHTINGHVYNYVAYAVYEGYNDTISVGDSTVTVLTSQSEKNPSINLNRNTFRTYAHNYEMDSNLSTSEDNPAYSMLWNFYQWELYKYCAFSMMEDFNAQSTVGNGKVYTTDNSIRYIATGLLDQAGPYAGTIGDITDNTYDQDSVKLFIENAWGSLSEFVDGVVFNYTELYSSQVAESATTVDIYIESVDTPTNTVDETGQYVDKIELSSRYHPEEANNEQGNNKSLGEQKQTKNVGDEAEDPSLTGNSYPLDIITNDARLWGFGDVPGGSASTGVSDYEWLPNSIGSKSPTVGGTSYSNSTDWPKYGLSSVFTTFGLTAAFTDTGTRLAFVFDVDTTSNEVSVSFANSPNGYGHIVDESDATVTSVDVPKGSMATIDGDEITIGYRTFTATPTDADAQWTYTFIDGADGWNIESGTEITSNTTVRAYYERTINPYTITWVYYDENGDLTSEETTFDYGTTPRHANPTRDYYKFDKWTPTIVKVTGNATYTATYVPITYTVTWDPTGGYTSVKKSTGSVETAITDYPTPTRDLYTFAGWFTAPEGGSEIAESIYPNANVTYYAHWNPVTYTVTFDANGGSSAAQATGSQMSGIALPSTTLATKYFAGWYDKATDGKLVGFANTLYYPVENTTLYAYWSDTAIYTYSLNFNANGGYGAPSAMLAIQDTDGSHSFSIKSSDAKRAGMYFIGWATSSEATEPDYEAGAVISVDANSTLTLYAVWSETEPSGPIDWIYQAVPIVIAVGMLMGLVTLLFYNRKNMDPNAFVTAVVAVTIGGILLVGVLMPVFGLI